jgi:hypothetical protein
MTAKDPVIMLKGKSLPSVILLEKPPSLSHPIVSMTDTMVM